MKRTIILLMLVLCVGLVSGFTVNQWSDGTSNFNESINNTNNITKYILLNPGSYDINISFMVNDLNAVFEGNLKNYTNYFNNLTITGWELNASTRVNISHNSTAPHFTNGGSRCIEIRESVDGTLGLANYTYSITNVTKGVLKFDFEVPIGATINGRGWYLTETNATHLNGYFITLTADDPYYMSAFDGINYAYIGEFDKGTPYKLEIEFDTEADIAKYYVDGVYKTMLKSRGTKPLNISEMRFRGTGQKAFYIDNLVLLYNSTATSVARNFSVFYDNVLAYNKDALDYIYYNVTFKGNSTSDFLKKLIFTINNSDSRLINIKDLFVQFNTNLTIQVNSESTDTIYNKAATPVRVNRVYNNITWDTKTTTNGIFSFQTLPISGIVDIQYYDTTGFFPPRHLYYYNNPYLAYNQTIYVVNTSSISNVLFTLYRETGVALPSYYIKVLKYLPTYNRYVGVEMHKTDFNGQALLNLQTLNETYKFEIYDNNLSLVYSSGSSVIKSTSLNLVISLTEDIWFTLDNILEVEWGEPYFDNSTNQLIAYYNDPKGVLDYVDYAVYRRTLYGDIQVCANRSYSSSATLRCSINPNQTGIFVTELWAETKGNYSYTFIGSTQYQQNDTPAKTGNLGLLLTAIIVVGLVGMSLWNPAITVFFSLAALIISLLLKISYISIGTLIAIVIIGGIAIFKMRT